MRQRLIETVGRSARLRVMNELKRTPTGLPVADLAARLGMSYMGVKDLCTDLERRGLLDTWRQPVKLGRPQMLYRLTAKAQELYPAASNAFTIALLDSAQKLYGPSAPEKLLHITYQKKAEECIAQIRGATVAERAKCLAGIRDRDGCMAEFLDLATGEMRIVEHHSPVMDLLRAFPIVARFEADMFRKILSVPVRREESGVSGLFCATFFIAQKSD